MAALLYDGTSRGGRGRESERREGQGAGNVETGRGAVCVACNHPLRSEVVEVVETR